MTEVLVEFLLRPAYAAVSRPELAASVVCPILDCGGRAASGLGSAGLLVGENVGGVEGAGGELVGDFG
jgi:hypothetical protein